MTFGEHLEELRRRLMVGILAFAVAFAAAFAFQDRLVVFFSQPFERARAEINAELAAKWTEKRKADPGLAPAVTQLVEMLREAGTLSEEKVATLRPLLARDEMLLAPQLPPLVTVSAFEGFTSYMLVCLITALVVAGPVLLYQLWQFVAAGLYLHERK